MNNQIPVHITSLRHRQIIRNPWCSQSELQYIDWRKLYSDIPVRLIIQWKWFIYGKIWHGVHPTDKRWFWKKTLVFRSADSGKVFHQPKLAAFQCKLFKIAFGKNWKKYEVLYINCFQDFCILRICLQILLF